MAHVNFRTDDVADQALAELTADGTTPSQALRQALLDSVRLRRREQMRKESLEASADPADRDESRRVLAEMADLRAR